MEGGSERKICISSKTSQSPLEMVQRSTAIPTTKPETVELAELISLIVADPEINVQVPVPDEDSAAESVAVSSQTLKSGPALGVIGFLATLSAIESI